MTDTICAPATALGGALCIIRLSGSASLSMANAVCRDLKPDLAPNTVHYAHITDGDEVIDEVLVSYFRAPHSYTGEDALEISCHGSSYILNRILELLIKNGCRMAKPGEFSMRAFLNGKMDLSQAEAVADLIASTNRATHQIALSQLRGHFSGELSQLRKQLLELTSLLELELDFSDHEDLEFADRTQLLLLTHRIDERITTLAKSFEAGQAIKAGIPVANVGKSTLLNRLLKEERAIVSDIHGTTRDTIEDVINSRGVAVRFIDTAGIRQTTDTIEQIGIDRTYQAIDRARIILWLIDKEPSEAEVLDMQLRCQGKSLLVVQNKIDIHPSATTYPPHTSHSSFLKISAKFGEGIALLEDSIYEAADLPDLKESDVIVTSARHHEALVRAHDNLKRVLEGMAQHLPGDIVAEDLRQVLSDLSEITGEGQIITSQETLNHIFKHHCVGK